MLRKVIKNSDGSVDVYEAESVDELVRRVALQIPSRKMPDQDKREEQSQRWQPKADV
jgi:hypothetical protein